MTNIMKQLALDRINYLMKLAFEIYPGNPDLANRYVELARAYSMSAKVKIPIVYKKFICHKCKKLMVPGYSARYRIISKKKRGSYFNITCLNCGHKTQIYFKARKNPKSKLKEYLEQSKKGH
ncbi:MAG: ribonuclease P protein component 4 [Promethearchaeota archaeon]